MSVSNLIPWAPWSRPRALARREEADPYLSLNREVNRLFDDFFRGFDGMPVAGSRLGVWPPLDVAETDKEVRITAELPGLADKDVELLVEENMLILRGEKKAETEDASRNFSERFYGRFERRIALPADVDQEKVGATFQNGLLTITLPRSETKASSKRVQITTH